MANFNDSSAGDMPSIDSAIRRTDHACRTAIDGRRAARALTSWARRFSLSEPDFQVLWCLRFATERAVDQATLASRLALSPAQVSMTVERLGKSHWILCTASPEDRRRKLWQLTDLGLLLLEQLLAEIPDFGSLIAFTANPKSAIRNDHAAPGMEAA